MANFLGLGHAWDKTYGKNGLGGFLFGHGTQALVPPDMKASRQQHIDLLMSLLKPGAFDAGGAGSNFFYGAGGDKMSALLNQPTPETDAYNTARPILEGMLTGTGPQFERDIGAANSQGGRFGSANAILRGEALRNLFNGRQQTAQTLGMMAGQAGASTFDRTAQMQNQRMQLLAGLFGMSGQETMQFPVQQSQGHLGEVLKILMSVAGARTPSAPGGTGGAGKGGTIPSTTFQQPWLNG